MNVATVDLYEYHHLPKPQGAVGQLTCYMQPDGLRPAVLVLPGGGYSHVSEREGKPIALRLVDRGFCAFVLDYAVAPLGFPTALREAAMAMGYIRENAEKLGICKRYVAAMGFSAGGHLCGSLGTLFDCPEVMDLGPGAVLRPDALGLCYPVTISYSPTHEGSFACLCGEDRALRHRLSLDRLVRPDMPPTYLWHTRNDASVPCEGTLILSQKMVQAGLDCVLHLYGSGRHGLATADLETNTPEQLEGLSADVPGWIDEFVLFLRERGFAVAPNQ